MSAQSIGAILGRKSRTNPDNPTDPVRAHSWDVDDPKANPGRRIGDGSTEFGWAFEQALKQTAKALHQEQYDRDYDGPHFVQRAYLPVIEAVLAFLDYKTGALNAPYQAIADKARVALNTAKRAIECFEFWGLINHVRRSVKVEDAEGQARPQRKQAPNAYYFDCRRQMTHDLWAKFWGKVMLNLKRVGHAAARRAAILKHSFNEVAKQAPRPKDNELAAILARMKRDHFSDSAAAPAVASGASASP